MLGYFIIDFLACAPILVYEATSGFTTDYNTKLDQIDTTTYKLFVIFKLFKLAMLTRISQSINFIQDTIKDILVR